MRIALAAGDSFPALYRFTMKVPVIKEDFRYALFVVL